MAGLTLDTGTLIAAERNDRRVWAYALEATRRGLLITVPAVVLAQAWRGRRSARMAQFLKICVVEPLVEPIARSVGELCGRTATTDIVDACVVVSAAKRGDEILTNDPGDLTMLSEGFPTVQITPLHRVH